MKFSIISNKNQRIVSILSTDLENDMKFFIIFNQCIVININYFCNSQRRFPQSALTLLNHIIIIINNDINLSRED